MKNLIRGIKNVWKWLPIIWRDRDWDYGCILEILIFKLDNMEKFMRTKGVCASAETIADDIEEVSTIAKRLLNDNYDLVPFWQYSILDNKIDTTFAQNRDTGETITKREFYDMAHKSRDEREKDLDDFVSKFRNFSEWYD